MIRRITKRAGVHGAIAAALAFATVSIASAAEPTTEVPAGGLVYAGQQSLITSREDVVLAVDRVGITYTVQNATPEPRTAMMAFALPELDMMALDGASVDNPAFDPANAANFVGFSALVDGQPAETYVESRALSLGLVDATRPLRDLALPLYPLHPDLGALLAALPATAKADLLARSLIRVVDGKFEPQWTLKTTLFWQQPFAAGQTHAIVIAYRPIAGAGTWTAETSAQWTQRYCVPAAVAADLSRRASGTEPVAVKWVHYLASAGAAARGAVTVYRFAIETASTRQQAYTCRAGLAATSSSAGAREQSQSDGSPDDEVQVLFVH